MAQTETGDQKISIFQYSPKNHGFSSSDLSMPEADGDKPSRDWKNEREAWMQSCGGHSQPAFDRLEDLQTFNQKGAELSERLQEELPNSEVEPFQPVYDDLRVSTASWWHLRDERYGFPVSIQNLPVSDELKSEFCLWRRKRDDHCLADEVSRHLLEKEGDELQARLNQELHQHGGVIGVPLEQTEELDQTGDEQAR